MKTTELEKEKQQLYMDYISGFPESMRNQFKERLNDLLDEVSRETAVKFYMHFHGFNSLLSKQHFIQAFNKWKSNINKVSKST